MPVPACLNQVSKSRYLDWLTGLGFRCALGDTPPQRGPLLSPSGVFLQFYRQIGKSSLGHPKFLRIVERPSSRSLDRTPITIPAIFRAKLRRRNCARRSCLRRQPKCRRRHTFGYAREIRWIETVVRDGPSLCPGARVRPRRLRIAAQSRLRSPSCVRRPSRSPAPTLCRLRNGRRVRSLPAGDRRLQERSRSSPAPLGESVARSPSNSRRTRRRPEPADLVLERDGNRGLVKPARESEKHPSLSYNLTLEVRHQPAGGNRAAPQQQ